MDGPENGLEISPLPGSQEGLYGLRLYSLYKTDWWQNVQSLDLLPNLTYILSMRSYEVIKMFLNYLFIPFKLRGF